MRRHRTIAAGIALAAAGATLLGVPSASTGHHDNVIEDGIRAVDRVGATLPGSPSVSQPRNPVSPGQPLAVPGGSIAQQTPGTGTYQPPLHGANPHGQGSVAVLDLQPSATRPLAGDPTGAGDLPGDREEVVAGRARGEQREDGRYHGHVTILALFGEEVVGRDTEQGQTATGPLEPLQANVLDRLCQGSGSNICLEVLRADSATTETGSQNSFAVASARVGGQQGISTTVAESNGNVSQDGDCQAAHGDSTAASVSAGGTAVADALRSSSDSRACRDGTTEQQNASTVIGLGGQGVPVPAAGCANGTPDTETGIPTLAPIVCNPDDSNGQNEAIAQAPAPYGVREALTVFALESGGTALLKAVTAASESRAVAPAQVPPDTPDDTPDEPDTPNDPDTPNEPEGPGR
jgi:hypothetical protein